MEEERKMESSDKEIKQENKEEAPSQELPQEETPQNNEETPKTEQGERKEGEESKESKESKESLPIHTPIPPSSNKGKKEARYILFLIYNKKSPIDTDDVFELIDQLNKISTPPEETRIDMVILSNGGYPHTAYQMMNIIRAKTKKLKAVVPLFAKVRQL